MYPETRGVNDHRFPVVGWITPGCSEEIVCIDTEGWELGKKNSASVKECMELARKGSRNRRVTQDVLKHRLVFVLVLSYESRANVKNPEFLSLVKRTCQDGHRAAGGCKPVLVPVLTKMDLVRAVDKKEVHKMSSDFQETLKNEVGDFVEVGNPCLVTAEDATTVKALTETLATIGKEQLKSNAILEQVRRLIHEDLSKHLQTIGNEDQRALARRHAWAMARMHGIVVQGLATSIRPRSGGVEEATPWWKETDRLVEKMKHVKCHETTACDVNDCHIDELRSWERKRKSSSSTSASTPGGPCDRSSSVSETQSELVEEVDRQF